jgi:ATP-dependent DNA helicase RecG
VAVAGGRQVAVLCPTTLLAEQHAQTFRDRFASVEHSWPVRIVELSRFRSAKEVTDAIAGINAGTIDIVIGTHKLLTPEVRFDRLGLVIIDEEHRFGVRQKERLKSLRAEVDVLTLTATPIPRTLAMAAYADLDVSAIDELPPGRTPVQTVVLSSERRPELIERIRAACAEGRQAYWVCTLIDDSDEVVAQAAQTTYETLTQQLPELRIALVHGRLKAAEKQKTMAAFKAGELQLLVATTVIEVGVDVPNASLMIIENAERLGLAQLHQLRGRVGRGSAASSCVLLYQTPLSQMARQRLATMRETNDGFVIAEKDLELRGPGELLGTRQTGLAAFRIADLGRDAALLPTVQRIGEALLRSSPELAERVTARWVGGAARYASA